MRMLKPMIIAKTKARSAKSSSSASLFSRASPRSFANAAVAIPDPRALAGPRYPQEVKERWRPRHFGRTARRRRAAPLPLRRPIDICRPGDFFRENSMVSFRLTGALLLGAAFLAAPALGAEPAKPRYGTWGVDETLIDRSVKPGDDFFGYALGAWLRDAPFPSDKARIGYNYDLPDETEREVRRMVEDAGKQPSQPPFVRQIVDYYGAWMDEAGIEKAGLAPARLYLARIAAVKDKKALVLLMSEPGYAAPIGIGVGADVKDPTRYAVYAQQARLGLPTRDYYLLTGAKY